MSKWVIRTIRNGRVKIAGNWYYPSEKFREYKGTLDGSRYVFVRYPGENYVYMWGSEKAYKDKSVKAGPELIDGVYNWMWWHQKGEEG